MSKYGLEHLSPTVLAFARQEAASVLGHENVVSLESLQNPRARGVALESLGQSLDRSLSVRVEAFVKEQTELLKEVVEGTRSCVVLLRKTSEQLSNRAIDREALAALNTKLQEHAPWLGLVNSTPESISGALSHSLRVLGELGGVLATNLNHVLKAIQVSYNNGEPLVVKVPATPFGFLHGLVVRETPLTRASAASIQISEWLWVEHSEDLSYFTLGQFKDVTAPIQVSEEAWVEFFNHLATDYVTQAIDELETQLTLDTERFKEVLTRISEYVNDDTEALSPRSRLLKNAEAVLTHATRSLHSWVDAVDEVAQSLVVINEQY